MLVENPKPLAIEIPMTTNKSRKFFTQLFKGVRRWCKRAYVRYVVTTRKFNERGQQVSDTERYIVSIARMVINHPDTEFQIEPNSGKRYLKNESVGIYIIFYKGRIEVTNHVFAGAPYTVIATDRNWSRILKMYNNVVERICLDYEDQIMTPVKNSLSLIHEKIYNESLRIRFHEK